MATLQNSVQISEQFEFVSEPSSFQAVFSHCYSHGLESIYKLENVDLNSIRKLSVVKQPQVVTSEVSKEEWIEDQLTFDFGAFYRGWMAPHILQEPIQVLNLPKPVEKKLLEHRISKLQELKTCDLHALKLGQGHIEEIRSKIKRYFYNKSEDKTIGIDFISLIKCIFGDKDPCKAYVFLEPYKLHDWIILTPSEAMEVKRITKDQKRQWQESLLAECQGGSFFKSIMETWIKPWMYARGGIATREELGDYLILRSNDESYGKKAWDLFEKDPGIFSDLIDLGSCYALTEDIAKQFQMIEATAKSYFKQSETKFFLNELTFLILRELVKAWYDVSWEAVIQVLKVSNSFQVYRDEKGRWCIHENLCAKILDS